MANLTHKSTGWEGSASQAGTYTFATKEKYMDQDIKFTVGSGSIDRTTLDLDNSTATITAG